MSHKIVSMTFFTNYCTQNFFFMGESVTPWIVFLTQAKHRTMMSLSVNVFLQKHLTHSINFTLFALLNHPKFNGRPLFKPEAF